MSFQPAEFSRVRCLWKTHFFFKENSGKTVLLGFLLHFSSIFFQNFRQNIFTFFFFSWGIFPCFSRQEFPVNILKSFSALWHLPPSSLRTILNPLLIHLFPDVMAYINRRSDLRVGHLMITRLDSISRANIFFDFLSSTQ